MEGSGRRCNPAGSGGFALVAVIWMLAALALLVSALVAGVRAEVRGLQGLRDSADAAASADAAIYLTLRELVADADRPVRATSRWVQWDAQPILVRIYPAEGFVDLNMAEAPLLADVFTYGGGLDAVTARELADAVVAWRTPGLVDNLQTAAGGSSAQKRSRFDTIEDLLQVPGMDFALFDRIRDLLTTSSVIKGVDPLAASETVLAILAGGDQTMVARIATLRDADDPVIDTTELSHAQPNAAGALVVRLDAHVVAADGRVRVRSVWVQLDGVRTGMPWEVIEVLPVRGTRLSADFAMVPN